jgi:Tir chaperone family protein CesT
MRQLGVEGFDSELAQDEDLYTVTVDDGTAVHFVGSQAGLVHIWSFPGKLPEDVSRDTLVVLLAINGVTFDYPAVHVGVDRASGELMLWARHPLAQLDADSVRKLFERFVTLTAQLGHWLEAGANLPTVSEPKELPNAFFQTA